VGRMPTPYVVLLGGVLPAMLWGVTAVFQKLSAQHATGPAAYLAAFGGLIALAGVVSSQLWPPAAWSREGLAYAAAAGLTFAGGTGLIALALWRYQAPLSQLAPIWSCNVLVTVAISAFVLGEMSVVNVPRLALGTLLIVAGALLVTYA
jgi:uncharacterized membrane protein